MAFEDLSYQTRKVLGLYEVFSAEDLDGMEVDQLKRMRTMGRRSLEEIKSMMADSGYEIREGRFVRSGKEGDQE